ncbi:hypothetical protein HYH02_012147 [Chlamydomonas schloesseri]|uniref:DNL-type domain-containing protein n=1 Tax=Chlamydomonas schloesseri TaxID=2026947 RepID=A0A835W3W0_9CHLO|nr:hypothetical protein HYH02_012147 [Chlamydomonas schloesseri]|eukprot:KAG2434951.1 hypothetical protein HYH02_012147 [Chlamydomonas schloesseri]
MRTSTSGFRTFASGACTVNSITISRGYCSSFSGSNGSNSDSADGEEGSAGHRHGGLEPGATPLAAIQPRMVMVFTCTKCDTRSTKAFSKQSYQQGVVLVRCPGCKGLHLVADHLGWFGEEPFVLHEHVAQLGGNVVRIAANDPSSGEVVAAASAAVAPAAGAQEAAQQQATAAAGAGEDPGLAARTAAAVAAAESSEGGLFELSDESQVRTALAEARELKEQHHHRQQH